MVNHLTGFLNNCALAFKRDNYLETSSSVKQKTPRPSAIGIFCVTNDEFLGDYPLQIAIPPLLSFIQFYTYCPAHTARFFLSDTCPRKLRNECPILSDRFNVLNPICLRQTKKS